MRNFKNLLIKIKIHFGIFVTIASFLFILISVIVRGYSNLSFEFIFGINKPEGESMLPAIINTIIIIFGTILISAPIGIGCAIYLNEYSRSDSKLLKFIRISIESLAGVPSIIYGLFGYIFFVITFKMSWSILAAILTLAIMILPIIVRSTEESLKSVPNTYREGSYALGVGKLRTILKIVLPSSISGILVSIILSIGRIVGESAVLIFTAGTVMKMPSSIFSSGSTLSVFMYTLTVEGLHINLAYTVAIVLIFIVLILNTLVNFIVNKLKRG